MTPRKKVFASDAERMKYLEDLLHDQWVIFIEDARTSGTEVSRKRMMCLDLNLRYLGILPMTPSAEKEIERQVEQIK